MTQTSRKQTKQNKPKAASEAGSEAPSEAASDDQPEAASDDRPGPVAVLRKAREQLAELTGLTPESASSLERTDEGWDLTVEVLELARVPETMSLLATYAVTVDPQGELTGYRRVRRYERGRADPPKAGG
ncbi:gas vesicle protein [Streptomyces aureoverticillatus]|nr:gas vesicle protein [Streptomyces aureoverticillatus]